MHYRMFDQKFAEGDLTTQDGLNFEADGQLVDLQKWWLIRALGASDNYVVEVGGKRREVEVESAHLRSSACSFVGPLNDLAKSVLLEAGAFQIEVSSDCCYENKRQESRDRRTNCSPPLHNFS